MHALSVTGRVIYGAPFALFGLMHFAFGQGMAGMVPVAGGVIWVYLTGVALVAASIGITTGVMGKWAGIGLGILLLSFVFTIHLPGMLNAADQMAQQQSLSSGLKDLMLSGAAFHFGGLFGEHKKSAVGKST